MASLGHRRGGRELRYRDRGGADLGGSDISVRWTHLASRANPAAVTGGSVRALGLGRRGW